jgi:hypothetical protein
MAPNPRKIKIFFLLEQSHSDKAQDSPGIGVMVVYNLCFASKHCLPVFIPFASLAP